MAKKKKPQRDPADEPWDVAFYKRREPGDDFDSAPGQDWLDTFPDEVAVDLIGIVREVAARPPQRFSTGTPMWQVMHDDMAGLCEARKKRGKTLYRLFCLLDRDGPEHGLKKPTVVVISGGEKPQETEMPDWVYQDARSFRDNYRSSSRRPVVEPVGIPAKYGR